MTDLTITWNNCQDHKRPDFSEFDFLIIAACVEYTEHGESWVEPLSNDEEEPAFYSVYGHCIEGGRDCLHDFPDKYLDEGEIYKEVQKLSRETGLEIVWE